MNEIEAAGRDRIIRFVLRDGDPFTMYGLLDALHINATESVDLIAAFEVLRARNFPLEALAELKRKARCYLQRLLGETPVEAAPLPN